MKNLILISLLFFGCGPKEQTINVDAGNDDSENSINQGGASGGGGISTSGGGTGGSGNATSETTTSNPYEEHIPDDYVPEPLPEPLPEPMPEPDAERDGIITWICKFLPKNPICEFGSDLGDDAVNGIICSILPNLNMCKPSAENPSPENPKPEPNDPIKVCEDKIFFEAEAFTSQAGYSVIDHQGEKVIQVGDSGIANYKINFPSAGRWYVHIKTMAEGHTDNGLYLNVNGERVKAPSNHPLAGKSQIWLMKGSVWHWFPKFQGGHSEAEGPVTFDLTSGGERTFSIEKKLVERPYIDKVVLAKSELTNDELNNFKCENENPENPNENIYFNLVIEQTTQACASCGIIFDWEGNPERKPLLKINYGNGSGNEISFRNEINSISIGTNRFNNKQNVMLLKKQFDSKGYLIANISALPKNEPINSASLCLNLHSKEGLANSDKTSVLSVFDNSNVWNYEGGVSEQKNGLIRELRADRDFWGQGISKANPWGCYDFTDYVTNLQNNR